MGHPLVKVMKIAPKVSLKLRPSQGNVLEFAQVKREPAAPAAQRRASKSWKGRLMRKLKNKGEGGDDDLERYKDLKLRTSTFRTYPFISLYILSILRFIIFLYSAWVLKALWTNFHTNLDEFAAAKVDELIKGKQFRIMKYFAMLLVASKDNDRCLMLTGLGIFLPMLSIVYCYLVGSLLTLYTATFDLGTDDLIKSIWIDYCEKRERGSKIKSFFTNRMESCTARFDCVLGYAFTLPVMNFLSLFNFKTAPHLSISSGLALIILILADELVTSKRKFEVEALLRMLKMYSMIGVIGLLWIFFIRFVSTEYLMEKLSTEFTEDLGIGIFVCVIIFTVHAAGCAFKYVIRRMKPSEPKIMSVPNFNVSDEGENENFV